MRTAGIGVVPSDINFNQRQSNDASTVDGSRFEGNPKYNRVLIEGVARILRPLDIYCYLIEGGRADWFRAGPSFLRVTRRAWIRKFRRRPLVSVDWSRGLEICIKQNRRSGIVRVAVIADRWT